MAGLLIVNPSVIFHRSCVIGGSVGSDLYLFNDGDASLNITGWPLTTGTKFRIEEFTDCVPPFTMIVGARAKVRVWFEPVAGDEGTLLTDTMTIANTGSVTPVTVAISGWAQEKGSSRMSMSPSSWTFDWVDGQDFTGGIGLDQESNELHLQIISSGDLPLTIYAINGLYPLRLIPPFPMLPAVLLPGTSLLLFLTLTASVAGVQTLGDSLEILSDAPEGSELYVVAYTGIALTSAYSVTGTVRALFGLGASVKVALNTDLNCEEVQYFRQTTNLGTPFVDRTFTQLRVKYEDKGESRLGLTMTSGPGGTTSVASTPIGTVGADNTIKEVLLSLAPYNIAGEFVETELLLTASSGALSLTEFAYVVDEGNELAVLEGLPAVASAYSVTGAQQCLFAFGTSLLKTEPLNLACEEAASLVKTTNFAEPFVDKIPLQLWLKYENLGQSAVGVSVVANGVTDTDSVAIGTVGADNTINQVGFTFHVEGEFAALTLSVAANAGPVSITELAYGIDEWNEFAVLEGLAAVTSVYSVTGAQTALLAFGSTVLKSNPTNLDCEEAAYFVRTHDFQLSGFEKHVPYATLKYEDFGVATFSLTAKSKRETIGPVSVTIGTVGADKLVKWTQTNLAINEEILEFTLNRAALGGPLSFTEQMFRLEQRGEVREGT